MYINCNKIRFKSTKESEFMTVGENFNNLHMVQKIVVDFDNSIVIVGCSKGLLKVYKASVIEADIDVKAYGYVNFAEAIEVIVGE